MSFSTAKVTYRLQSKVRAGVASNVPISPGGALQNQTQTDSLCKGICFLASSAFATEQIFAKSRYISGNALPPWNLIGWKQPFWVKTPK
jgi:hypothetical protein